MNFLRIGKHHLWSFGAGVVATVVGVAVAKSPKTREVVVKGMATGMKLQHDAQEAIQNMREEAEDLVVEATREADLEAE